MERERERSRSKHNKGPTLSLLFHLTSKSHFFLAWGGRAKGRGGVSGGALKVLIKAVTGTWGHPLFKIVHYRHR